MSALDERTGCMLTRAEPGVHSLRDAMHAIHVRARHVGSLLSPLSLIACRGCRTFTGPSRSHIDITFVAHDRRGGWPSIQWDAVGWKYVRHVGFVLVSGNG